VAGVVGWYSARAVAHTEDTSLNAPFNGNANGPDRLGLQASATNADARRLGDPGLRPHPKASTAVQSPTDPASNRSRLPQPGDR